MNRLFTCILCFLLACSSGVMILSCNPWDLPTKKSQRECVKPSGTLNAQPQQRIVDFSISGGSGTIDKVVWDFGNGSTATTTGLTTKYTYPANGTYTVKATLTNTCGLETTLQQVVTVSDAVKPTVTLQAITAYSATTAVAGMSITSNGNAPIIRYGVCYSAVKQSPEVDIDKTESFTTTAPLNTALPVSLTNLQPNTLYYVRSFAVNSAGLISYSTVQTFQTGQNPAVAVNGTASVGITTAGINFIVSNLGNPAAYEFGIYYSSTTSTPDVNSPAAKVASPSVGNPIVITLNDLTPSKIYYYRAYARLSSGEIIYGPILSFTTQADPVSQDLIASVSFNDKSLQDVSGYNNHVKLVDNATFTTDRNGRANSAILLDGSGDYFYMDDNSSLNPDAMTVSLWIKPVAINGRMQIYNKSRFSDGLPQTYSSLIKLEGDVGPALTFMTNIKQNSNCVGGVGWQDLAFTSPVVLNTWYHLVFTYSGRSARMYFNNILVFKTDNLPATAIDKCPGGELKFGAQYQSLPWYFNGAMDDIRIYKRAITAAEVETLFKQ
ncbi:LamG-like jellyroll fold domain-containing protein [Spirosoma linguale]